VVRVERNRQSQECQAGSGCDLINTTDGAAVRFTASSVLQPDDVWDLRYLTSR